MGFKVILARDGAGGIGQNGKLPWRLPMDMRRFKEITLGRGQWANVVIMGRVTFESIGRVLPGRVNIVISRTTPPTPLPVSPHLPIFTESFESALEIAYNMRPTDIFVIGGQQVYKEALSHKDCDALHVTTIMHKFNTDRAVDLTGWELASIVQTGTDGGFEFDYSIWKRAYK